MKLRDVISTLEAMPPDKVLSPGFGAADSYRGYYHEIAFAPLPSATVAEMLEHARAANGATYSGYKGGEYRMDLDTNCNVAEYGWSNGGADALTPAFFGGERDLDAEAEVEAERYARAFGMLFGESHSRLAKEAWLEGYRWIKSNAE